MTKTESDLEMIRLRMEFGTWLHECSNIRLSSGLGEFMFRRWLEGKIVALNINARGWQVVTFHD